MRNATSKLRFPGFWNRCGVALAAVTSVSAMSVEIASFAAANIVGDCGVDDNVGDTTIDSC